MWPQVRSWLRGVARRGRLERELAEEVSAHLQARTEHWIRHGASPGEAARKARLEFGAVEAYKKTAGSRSG